MTNIIQGNFPLSQDEVAKKKEKTAPIYQLHLHLTYSDPPIWRRFQVPGEFTLARLHEVIKILMNWSGEQAHKFYVGKIFFTMPRELQGGEERNRFDESQYTLQDLEESMKWCFIYLYDAGEGWEHEIELEEIVPASQGENFPLVMGGERAAPPESIAGIHAYEQCVNDWQEGGKERPSDIEEFHPDFEPDVFDIATVNKELKELGGYSSGS